MSKRDPTNPFQDRSEIMGREKQLDLEIDATGIEEQLTLLAERAIELGCRWLSTFNHKTRHPSLAITDDAVVTLLKQAAAVQHLLDKINQRKH